MHAWATALVLLLLLLLLLLYCIHSSLALAVSWHGQQLAGIPLLAPGTWHGQRQRHYRRLHAAARSLQLSKKPLRALPLRRGAPRRTLPEVARVTQCQRQRQCLHLVLARLLRLRVLFIFFIFCFFYLFIFLACFSAFFFLVMAPFLHDFVIYMHTHAWADTYTRTHTHCHTYSELFLRPVHVPRMFGMHLLRACLSLSTVHAGWQLIWKMRKLLENATSSQTYWGHAAEKRRQKKKHKLHSTRSRFATPPTFPRPHGFSHPHSICGFSVTLGHNLIATELCCGFN